MNTEQPQTRSALHRVSAPAAALVAIYLLSGLFGNLHMVLVDHHGVLDHGHKHHAAACPGAEWTPSSDCGDHHVLADHDVVEANTTRSSKDATQSAVLPCAAVRSDGSDGNHAVVIPVTRTLRTRVSSCAPIRAPPADLLSV